MKKSIQLKLIMFIFFNCQNTQSIYAQGENNNWIFGGGCYISFNNGVPALQGELKTLYTFEGCTSVSDADGKLLFYSDGMRIWTKTHSIMQNGTGLLGDFSSTSSCVIVPFPGHKGQYYVFCTDANFHEPNNGLTYNIVDLSYDRGLGKVTLKNQLLLAPADEKIAVTRHCNGRDFWIVSHEAKSDKFYTWLLNSKGLSFKPTITFIKQSLSAKTELGFLKFSPDGTWLANTQCLGQVLEIYKFNKSTGIMTLYAIDREKYTSKMQSYYGLAFSPNNTKLYATSLDEGMIYQYDLNEPHTSIFKKRVMLNCLKHAIGAMQLGSDNKIYISDGYYSSYLHTIDYPEKKGFECRLNMNAFKLNENKGQLGLPTYVESMDKYYSIKKDSIISQFGYVLDARINDAIYEWSTGETTKSIKITANGKYWVKVYTNSSCVLMTDTIIVNIYSKKLKLSNNYVPLIHVCDKGMITIPRFMCDSTNVTFLWTNSNPAIGLPASGSGQIAPFVAPKVEKETNAMITVTPLREMRIGIPFTIFIRIHPDIPIKIIPVKDIEICAGNTLEPIRFKSEPAGANFTWQNNNATIDLEDAGEGDIESFYANISNENKLSTIHLQASLNVCNVDSSSFHLLVKAIPASNHPGDRIQCAKETPETVSMNANPPGALVHWFSNSNNIQVPATGNTIVPEVMLKDNSEPYFAKILYSTELAGCHNERSSFLIEILPSPRAGFKYYLADMFTETSSNLFQFTNQSVNSSSFMWSFGDSTLSFEESPLHAIDFKKPSVVKLMAENSFGCKDTFSAIPESPEWNRFFIPSAFSPDENNRNEVFSVNGIDATEIQFWIYDRWGQELYYTPDNKGWNGQFEDKVCEAGVYLYKVKATDHFQNNYEYNGTVTLMR